MIIIKSIMFIISIIFIIYRYGIIINKITKNHKLENTFIFGLILWLSVNQLILTPCTLIHTSFRNCLIAIILITIVLLAISFGITMKKSKDKTNRLNNIKSKYLKMPKVEKCITIIMVILITFQVISTTVLFRENADDSYYVGLTTSSIDNDNVYMEEPSTGYKSEEHTMLLPTEQIPTYELNIAILSKIFNIEPTIIYHTLLPIIFIVIAYMSYYYFARSFLDKKNAKIFIIFISIIFMFAGFTTKFRTGCLLCKMWQGKAVFLNIVLNIILASLIRMDKKVKKSDVIILTLANLSATHLTSTAIFLITFVYISFGILKLIKLKIKDIAYLFVTFIPIFVYVVILIVLMKTHFTKVVLPQNPVNTFNCFRLYGNDTYLIYYFIALFFIILFGNKRAKRYFIIIQILNLFTIWNPLFSDFISKYLTSSDTYWRVFWLLPLESTIAYAITILIARSKNVKVKLLVIILSIIAIILPGKYVYTTKISENLEKIPQYIIDQTNYILEQDKDSEKIVVLTPPGVLHSCMMRQLSSKIQLIYSRTSYVGKIDNVEEREDRLKMEEVCYSETHNYPIEDFNKLLEKYKVNWVIVSSEDQGTIEYMEKSIMNKNIEMGGYVLYNR